MRKKKKAVQSLHFGKLFDAVLADFFAHVVHNTVCFCAENACGSIFFKYYAVLVGEHFDAVSRGNVKRPSQLDRQYYSAQLVDPSYHAQ